MRVISTLSSHNFLFSIILESVCCPQSAPRTGTLEASKQLSFFLFHRATTVTSFPGVEKKITGKTRLCPPPHLKKRFLKASSKPRVTTSCVIFFSRLLLLLLLLLLFIIFHYYFIFYGQFCPVKVSNGDVK